MLEDVKQVTKPTAAKEVEKSKKLERVSWWQCVDVRHFHEA